MAQQNLSKYGFYIRNCIPMEKKDEKESQGDKGDYYYYYYYYLLIRVFHISVS